MISGPMASPRTGRHWKRSCATTMSRACRSGCYSRKNCSRRKRWKRSRFESHRTNGSPMTGHKLRLGVAGLGRGFVMMLPTLESHPRTQIVAAADPRAEARAQFEQDFGGATYASVDELCADPTVDAVYVATPH